MTNDHPHLDMERSSYYDSDESRRSYQFRSDPVHDHGKDYPPDPLRRPGCAQCGHLDSAWSEAGMVCCGCRVLTPWPWEKKPDLLQVPLPAAARE